MDGPLIDCQKQFFDTSSLYETCKRNFVYEFSVSEFSVNEYIRCSWLFEKEVGADGSSANFKKCLFALKSSMSG